MIQKELCMEQEKSQKNYWNKFPLFLIIGGGIILVFFCMLHANRREEVILSDYYGTTSPDMISINIKWRDSTCCIVLESNNLLYILRRVDEDEFFPSLHYKDFISLSYKDTLTVDSLSFMQLKGYMVTPQFNIDSIYGNEGVQGLLSAYFDDIWFSPREGELTLSEERYIIYILQQYGYYMHIECESGNMYIEKP